MTTHITSLKRVPDSFIDKIFYINLDHRIDRNISIQRQLSVFTPEKVSRFSAIYQPASGFVGCAQSHIQVLEMAIENNYKNVLIVEDDMLWNNLDDNYCVFQYLATKKHYDVIILGGSNALYDEETLRVTRVEAPVAYLVSNHYFKTLLENYKKGLDIFLRYPYSQAFCLDQYFKSLQVSDKWYIVRPCLCYQGDDMSDIENKYVELKKLYISQETPMNITLSIESFFAHQCINIFVRCIFSQKPSSFLPILDSFTKVYEFNISALLLQELAEFNLLFEKCMVDLVYLDFILTHDIFTAISKYFTKTRYILIESQGQTLSILPNNWVEYIKNDTHVLFKNTLF